ncbi:MAG: insulinase family protein [Lachnospiraceae bacterium]|nr:insulinase family protein [Lachnospiraceae bacterium]
MDIEKLRNYELIEKKELKDIASVGYLLSHKKTGARISVIENDDSNKVFAIGFRTPPTDSTGVAHILEHSVLCGSKEFPLKDPFVELAKGSLNTFLNAFTFPDKTVYPIASTNDTDFRNLMHVYLDAVFYPNVYKNESIFRQEGWHYEYDEEGKLIINGVVYNEMKGMKSAAEDIISAESMFSLFPDNEYGVESGGDPDYIPSLTYEQFLDFHRSYYHPSNSYIYLYGNSDMLSDLEFIDRKYLSRFNHLDIDSSIKLQKPFSQPVKVMKQCALSQGENADENTFFSVNFALEEALDTKTRLALEMIDYALVGNPGAPLRKILVEQGVVGDVSSRLETSLRQPYYTIVGKDAAMSMETRFGQLITETIETVAKKGFDKNALRAAIDSSEFRYREADFGRYPKGLMYGITMFDSWLYDDSKPFEYIEAEDAYDFLRENIETGYFEKLVRKYFIGNKHRSYVCVRPTEGVQEMKDKELRKMLDSIQTSLTPADKKAIDKMIEGLNKFRDTPDSEAAIKSLPMLTRDDLKREIDPFINDISDADGVPFIFHETDTRRIGYLRLAFKTDKIGTQFLPYVGLLRDILSMVDTKDHRYEELNPMIDLIMGGFNISTELYSLYHERERFVPTFEVKAKYFNERSAESFDLIKEILFDSKFSDLRRIKDVLVEIKNSMQSSFLGAGHSIAAARAMASVSKQAAFSDIIQGVSYYRFICGLLGDYDAQAGIMTENLKYVLELILRPENLIVDYTGDRPEADLLKERIASFREELFTEKHRPASQSIDLVHNNEGLITSGQVVFVCRAGRYDRHGLTYNGALKVLKVFLGYDYLWMNVRVKGGAYGVMNAFTPAGTGYFVSYRDPNLTKTVDVYEGAAEAVSNFDADERAMTKLIIGTISDMDLPLTPSAKGSRSFNSYMTGITEEDLQKIRDEVLDCTPEDIRKTSEYIKEMMADNKLVVVGNEKLIRENEKLFGKVENLL